MNEAYRDSYEALVGSSASQAEKTLFENIYKDLKKELWFEQQTPTRVFDRVFNSRNKFYAKLAPKHLCHLLLKRVGRYLHLHYQYILMCFTKENKYKVGPAGTFVSRGVEGGCITITISKSYDVAVYLAVIIHEMMHFFYFCHGIEFPSIEDEELSCDFGAVYLGLGRYLIEGYQPLYHPGKDVFGGGKELKIGYLTPRELGYCEAHYAFNLGTGNVGTAMSIF